VAPSEGKAHEEDGMRQRRRGHGRVSKAADQRQIGRHHRDLPKLRQRDRHRQLECFGQLNGEVMAGRCRDTGRRDRSLLDFIKG
jgi:hypothetical protein